MAIEIIYETHATTIDNEAGIATGWLPGQLSAPGIPIFQDARLRECNYGQFNGTPVERLVRERSRHIDEPFPQGQSYRQVVDQTRDLLRDLAAKWDGSRLVIIAHSANRWALEHLLLGIPLEALVNAPFTWQPGWRYTLPAGDPTP